METAPIFRGAPYPGESCHGFQHRVAWSNGYMKVADLPGYPGVKAKRQEILSVLSDFVSQEISSAEFSDTNLLTWQLELRDPERYTVNLDLSSTPKYCAICMQERAFHRRIWDYALYTVCHVHKQVLLTHCTQCDARLSWASPTAWRCKCGVRIAAMSSEDIAMEPGIEGALKLSLQAVSNGFDELYLQRLIAIAAQLVRPRSLIPAFINFSTIKGMDLARLCSAIQAALKTEQPEIDPTTALGQFLLLKASLLRSAAPGDKVALMEAIQVPEIISTPLVLSSEKTTYGLSKQLQSRPQYLNAVIASGADQTASDITRRIDGIVKTEHVASLLSIELQDVYELVEVEVISPINPDIRVKADWVFEWSHLDYAFRVIHQYQVACGENTILLDRDSSRKQLSKYNCRHADICAAVLAGVLVPVGGGDGFFELEFECDELRAFLEYHLVTVSKSFPLPHAAAVMDVDTQTIRILAKNGYLNLEKSTQTDSYQGARVPARSLALFLSDYVLLSPIANSLKTTNRKVANILSESGLCEDTLIIDGNRKIFIYTRSARFESQVLELAKQLAPGQSISGLVNPLSQIAEKYSRSIDEVLQ